MLYIDANVLVFATLNTKSCGVKAISLLQRIQQGEEQAITSALTIDETFWAVKKDRGVEAALEACHALLNFPNLDIVPATKEIVASALEIIREYHLDPRDAIHAATTIAEKADCIVSTDPHFDKVKKLKRQNL
jgi:predicted nucleic acid-binding protein